MLDALRDLWMRTSGNPLETLALLALACVVPRSVGLAWDLADLAGRPEERVLGQHLFAQGRGLVEVVHDRGHVELPVDASFGHPSPMEPVWVVVRHGRLSRKAVAMRAERVG